MPQIFKNAMARFGRPGEAENLTDDPGRGDAAHILVPVAMSQRERPALQLGLQLTAAWDAKLTVLHVMPPLMNEPSQGEEPISVHWLDAIDNLHQALSLARHALTGDRLKILEDARRRLAEYLAQAAPAKLRDNAAIRLECAFGDPAEEIVRFAAAESVDLVVLTSKLSQWRLPVVPARVHRILRGVRQQVIVVRPDGTKHALQLEAPVLNQTSSTSGLLET